MSQKVKLGIMIVSLIITISATTLLSAFLKHQTLAQPET
jgi:hypothetical protein